GDAARAYPTAHRARRGTGPDAVQVIVLTPGAGLVPLRIVLQRRAVAGPVGVLPGRAGNPWAGLGLPQRGLVVTLEHGRRHAGEEVRGRRQRRIRPAVAVGVDPDGALVARHVDVRPHRMVGRTEIDAARQLAPVALGAAGRREHGLDVEGQRRRVGAAEGVVAHDAHGRRRLLADEADGDVVLAAARLDRPGAHQRQGHQLNAGRGLALVVEHGVVQAVDHRVDAPEAAGRL